MSRFLALLLQLGATGPGAVSHASSLTAAAQASVRPHECSAPSASSSMTTDPGANVWASARDPNLQHYCELLARGFGQLPLAPQEAEETADLADRASPGHAGPWVLRGRALAQLKLYDRAGMAFDEARRHDSRTLEDPSTMREWARVLAHLHRGREALELYRTLGPRLSLLPTADERARTFLEAADLAFSLGVPGLDDAIAFLNEARRLTVRELEWRTTAELALALDRAGRSDESRGIASDLARRFRRGPKGSPSAENKEEIAATALALETIDSRRAILLWERYMASEPGPWQEHAQRRLEVLRKKGR